jgi:hypothetical protein
VATLTAILRDEPRNMLEVAPDIPPRLADVVQRCVRKVSDDRFQTMRDVHLALGTLKHESDSGVLYRSAVATPSQIQLPPVTKGSPSGSLPGVVIPPSDEAKKKKMMMIGGAAVAAVLIVGALALFMRPPDPTPPPAPVKEVAEVPPPAPEPEALTNDGVIQLVTAKVPLDVIYNQMRSAPTNFTLTAAEIARLTQAGVPPDVIKAMQDPKNIPVASASIAAPAPAAAGKNAPKSTPEAAKGATKSDPKGTASTPGPIANTPAPAAEVAAVIPPPVVETPRPRPEPQAQTKQVVLADASPFPILLSADIPEDAKEGFQLRFHVAKDVTVGDTVVIAKGASVTGQIAQGKGVFKKMTLRLLTVTGVDGKMHKIRALSARKKEEPERNVETNVKPKGNKVAADAGTEYLAYVDGDMTVTVRSR